MTVGLRRLSPAVIVGAGALLAAAAGATVSRPGGLVAVGAALAALALAALALHDVVGAIAALIVLSFVEQVPGAGSGVTVVKAVGALIALVWALGLLRGRWTLAPLLGPRLAFTACAAGFVVWAVDSALWAADGQVALSAGLRLAQGVLLAFVVTTCLADRRSLRVAALAFVLGASIAGLLGLVGVAGTSSFATPTDVRAGGGLGDPNYLAAVIVPGIFCAIALRATARRRAERLLLTAATVVLALGLLRSESRGGLIALVAGIAAAVAIGGRLRRPTLRAVGWLAGAGVVYLAVSSASLHRFASLGSGGGSGRIELWGLALRVFHAHPLAGVGAGNFPVVEPAYASATRANLTKPYLELDLGEVVHNTYLHLLAELGVVGLALFAGLVLAALVLGLRACRLAARRGDGELELLARGLLVGSIGMLVAFAFLTAQYEKQLWTMLALLLAANVAAGSAARPHPSGAV